MITDNLLHLVYIYKTEISDKIYSKNFFQTNNKTITLFLCFCFEAYFIVCFVTVAFRS